VLRGVEIYRGKPILYSLGAFIFRGRGMPQLPEELYENCQMPDRDPTKFFERTRREWDQIAGFWQSAIAQVEFEDNKTTGITLIPTVIRHDAIATWGMPQLASADESKEILTRVKRLSVSFGTTIEIDRSAGHIQI
jgi:poly-gamma-glutamate synthesis protein (capsule biosynthesis protein)